MKTALRLLFGLVVAAGATASPAELPTVPFAIGKQQFKAGDRIIIEQVLATSPKLEVGAKVVVRGHYELASAPKATLGLFITHHIPAGPDPTAPSQLAPATKAAGSFELACEIS